MADFCTVDSLRLVNVDSSCDLFMKTLSVAGLCKVFMWLVYVDSFCGWFMPTLSAAGL